MNLGLNLGLGKGGHTYRPLINYKWVTKISDLGERQLVDGGSSPKYDADLYFGQGAKFNGVDQSVDINKSFTKTNIYTISFKLEETFTAGSQGWIISSISPLRLIWVTGNSLKFYDGTNYTLHSVVEDGTYTIVVSQLLIEVYLNGININSVSLTYINVDWSGLGMIGHTTDAYSAIMNNIQFHNQELTPTQIAYQYNNPEKFLYREDNILKSMILTQDEIDKVVSYLPMCENDGYVRDLVGYSEGDIFNDDFTDTDISDYLELNVTGSVVNGSIEATTNSPTSGYYHTFINIDTLSYYLAEVETVTASTEHRLRVCEGLTPNAGIADSSVVSSPSKLSVVFKSSNSDINLYFRHTDTSTINWDNVRLTKLTSTYPIQNYTSAVRTDAQQLTNGLQTCFLKRDSLGVPYGGSFDRLECDGVGYADTGWVPNAVESWQIEYIFKINDATRSDAHGIGIFPSEGLNSIVYVSSLSTDSTVYLRAYDITHSFSPQINSNIHITLKYNHETKEVSAFVNGVEIGAVVSTEQIQTVSSFYIGAINGTSGAYRFQTDEEDGLFKVHTTPQDPLKLYQDAVNKGLLL